MIKWLEETRNKKNETDVTFTYGQNWPFGHPVIRNNPLYDVTNDERGEKSISSGYDGSGSNNSSSCRELPILSPPTPTLRNDDVIDETLLLYTTFTCGDVANSPPTAEEFLIELSNILKNGNVADENDPIHAYRLIESVRFKINAFLRSGAGVEGGDGGDGKRRDVRPSVWQMYYEAGRRGNKSQSQGHLPLFPEGRPETNFTLDLPRSEFLNKRLKKEKRWRCRCRLLTTFLGFIFFLLSVMIVSLILTRGKKIFGSML